MSFRDLEEFLDPTLKLPIRGKTYVVQSPAAKTGLWIQGMISAAAQIRAGVEPSQGELQSLVLDDDEERDAMARVLGSTFDEMVADGVPWAFVKHAGSTVMIWVVHGKESAEAFWNGPADGPKAPKRRKRKGGAKKGRPDSDGSSTPPTSSEETPSPGGSSSSTGT